MGAWRGEDTPSACPESRSITTERQALGLGKPSPCRPRVAASSNCRSSFRPDRGAVYELCLFFSAQRFFIISESFLRPAGVRPPLFFFGAAPAVVLTDPMPTRRRAAQRRFIACDRRLLPAGVRPWPRPGVVPAEERPADFPRPAIDSFSSAAIARAIRSRSPFNSETIDCRSKIGLPLGNRPNLTG